MKQMGLENIWKAVRLSWLTGPIFDKELRVSSRRKRNYVLRVAYLVLFLLVLSLVWTEMVGAHSNAVYQASRLATAGMAITGTVVMIQFFLALIVSVVMCSNSISDEVYRRTLGVLMSTPISMVQVVAGKLLSKLLQVTLLLCLTLPILGIIRVFGGVPWDYLIKSFCITLTAVIFTGLLTLNLSIHQKHAYVVIIRAVLGLILLFVIAPLFIGWIAIEQFDVKDNVFFQWVMTANPLFLMYALLGELFSPRGMPFATSYFWVWNCVFMLGCSALLFFRAAAVVRKKALLQACGQLDTSGERKRDRASKKAGKIHHVKGPPVLWKEWRDSRLKMGGVRKTIGFILVAGSVLVSYYIFKKEHVLDEEGIHIMYGMIFSILSAFLTAIYAATTITSEKASRTWPALLCTLVSDWQILWSKVIGVLRRSGLFWGLLFLHLVIFIVVGYIHPAAMLQILMIIVPLVFFVTCSGVLFSTLLKHTTSAVVANLIFIAFLWAGIPLLAAIIGEIMHLHDDLLQLLVMGNPFFYLGEVLNSTAGSHANDRWRQLSYDSTFNNKMGFIETTVLIWVLGSAYIAGGLGLLKIAQMRLRKKIV